MHRRGAREEREPMAMNDKILGDLSARLAELAASNPAKDLQKNFLGMLSSAFSRLDLVSREEYDVQAQVLARSREKLAALEARVADLEARLASAKREG
jgi:BMFP domain-containing protein YqiC